MIGIILGIIVVLFFYLHFRKKRVIEVDENIENMKNVSYKINNNSYNLEKI
jgi:hypothetical protein